MAQAGAGGADALGTAAAARDARAGAGGADALGTAAAARDARAGHPPAPGGRRAGRPGEGRRGTLGRDQATVAIAAATLLALGLRLWQLGRPGYLLGLTEYDDGPYFGSAVHLVQGVLPYRDFVLVQPPGITLLMTPAALASKLTGTAWAMAAGRILTALASTAGVVLTGLLVRHRGVVATTVACGFLAVYPDSVAAAHTVLVEPWLAAFCLAGAVAVFDGDRLAGRRRLAWGGAAFGFAGAIEAWAIVPVLVVLVLCVSRPRVVFSPPPRSAPAPVRHPPPLCLPRHCLPRHCPPRHCPPRLRRAAAFAAGVAAGFLIPVLPFAAAAPERFYRSLIVAQIGPRAAVTRVPVYARLTEMSGLAYLHPPGPAGLGFAHLQDHTATALGVMSLVLFIVGGLAVVVLAARRPPTALEWFAVATTALVVAIFLWPSQFHYHFCAFLAPFLALAIALPASGARPASGALPASGTALAASGTALPASGTGRAGAADRAWQRPVAAGIAAAVIAAFAVIGVRAENGLRPYVSPAEIAAAARVIPPGSCVVTDEVSLLLLADRFTAARPGCSPVVDGLGTDLALSGGLRPATGAGRVPAVAAVWRQAFARAQFVWLSRLGHRRIAWSPALRAYFTSHFTRVLTDRRGDALYRRVSVAAGSRRSSRPA
jgi:alpha-1,2-mannosyltransferase